MGPEIRVGYTTTTAKPYVLSWATAWSASFGAAACRPPRLRLRRGGRLRGTGGNGFPPLHETRLVKGRRQPRPGMCDRPALDEPVPRVSQLTIGLASRSAAGLDAPLFVTRTPAGDSTANCSGAPRAWKALIEGVRLLPAANGGSVLGRNYGAGQRRRGIKKHLPGGSASVWVTSMALGN
jgi:hypothetical protein